MQATSSVAGLQGFWLGGDFVNYGDGADAASAAPDQILPLVTSQTEVNITNINTGSITVSIRLFGNDGIELASAITRTIAGRGAFQEGISILSRLRRARPRVGYHTLSTTFWICRREWK